MYSVQSSEYDVVIMGAGFAGVCQARHLMLKIPQIKVALIDPRPPERGDKDLKLGESMIEVAALFVAKELGLYEYMIENQTPKYGLNFHWPKELTKTDTTDDYYHVWVNRQLPINSFHLNRAKFEQDLLKMDREMGASFYNGRVVDVDLTPQDESKTVKVKLNDGSYVELKAKHVIDAAGRKFIVGKKKDNVLFGPENLFGLNNGSAWMRIRNFDRHIFHDGYDPTGASCSHYYATNHWFGHGHWLWMIPSAKDPLELSIGIIHHHSVIPAHETNTQEKFLNFLEANHTVLHKLIASGEVVDFHYMSKISHTSKTLFSEDNWYVLGDAAHIFDAFYSYGTTMIAFQVESVTEIIRAKLAHEPDVEKKRSAYNAFNLEYSRVVNRLMHLHPNQLGNASIMSWRIYFEYMWWFGIHIALYIGKWHLDMRFIPMFLKIYGSNLDRIIIDVHEQLEDLSNRRMNLGLMDCYRGDQLLWGYHPVKHYDNFLENAKYEVARCNVFVSLRKTFFYIAVWYALFQWKGFGWRGLLAPRQLRNLIQLLAWSAQAITWELVYKYLTRGLSTNTQVEKMRQQFKTYRYQPQLQPWSPDVPSFEMNYAPSSLKGSDSDKIPALSALSD